MTWPVVVNHHSGDVGVMLLFCWVVLWHVVVILIMYRAHLLSVQPTVHHVSICAGYTQRRDRVVVIKEKPAWIKQLTKISLEFDGGVPQVVHGRF